nr:MAG TPA: hypothetical protein [Caudoviricetes sp.]
MLDELFIECIKESMSAAKKVEDSAKRSELYNNIAKTISEAKQISEAVPATHVEIKTTPKSLQEVMSEPLPDAIEEQVKNDKKKEERKSRFKKADFVEMPKTEPKKEEASAPGDYNPDVEEKPKLTKAAVENAVKSAMKKIQAEPEEKEKSAPEEQKYIEEKLDEQYEPTPALWDLHIPVDKPDQDDVWSEEQLEAAGPLVDALNKCIEHYGIDQINAALEAFTEGECHKIDEDLNPGNIKGFYAFMKYMALNQDNPEENMKESDFPF